MIISDVRTREVEGDWELRADVRLEAAPAESAPLWFRWPGGVAPPANPGDPFLAATLIPAMAVGEDLRIDAPVTTELLGAAADPLAPILRRWHGYREPAIAAAEARPAEAPAAGAGTCFSAGIDSFYSLHKHRDTLTHLVFIHGFEIPLDHTKPPAAALANVQAIADEWGKTLLPIASNINDVGDLTKQRLAAHGIDGKRFGVQVYFGSALVAIALCLQRVLGRVIVPSSWPYEYVRPNASHPLMEPNWSTPATTFELDGCEAGRMDKIRRLGAEAPHIFERLRVCVNKNTWHLNCGRCTKCVRTLMEMRVCGLLELATTFAKPLDLLAVQRLDLVNDDHFWPDIVRTARAAGDDEIAKAALVIMGERSRLERLMTPATKTLRELRRLRRRLRRWRTG